MGVRLIVEAIHHAPCDLSDAEARVLVVLAEDANDTTRECWPGMPELVARTHKAASSVRRILSSLEDRKLITRLSARTVQPGARPVVAHRGHRTVYRLEPMPGTSGSSDTEALTCEHHSGAKGAHPRAQRRSPVSGKALTREHPSPHVPSGPLTPPPAGIGADVVAEVRAVLLERSGRDVGDAWALTVATTLLSGRRGVSRPVSWIRAVLEREADLQRFLPVPRV